MQPATIRRFVFAVVGVAALAGCAETKLVMNSAKRIMGPSTPEPEASASVEYKIGQPYQIAGTWYYPKEDFEYDETGIASWYGTKFHGRKTANGEIYDMNTLTAAHRTLPLPSFVRVTNLDNGRSLILRVNDRGPFARGRIIDISRRGAQLLGFQRQGTARVRVQIMADRSQALKARLRNQADLAEVGSPITVDRLPKAKVQSQSLPPPGSPAQTPQVASLPTVQAPLLSPSAPAAPKPVLPLPTIEQEFKLSEQVEQTGKVNTSIYIQAGAFSQFDNASRVRARLAPLGEVKLSQVLVNGKDLYRVRVGPLADVKEADKVLAAVSQAGYGNARIVVD
jgi:rare lipoprotein A